MTRSFVQIWTRFRKGSSLGGIHEIQSLWEIGGNFEMYMDLHALCYAGLHQLFHPCLIDFGTVLLAEYMRNEDRGADRFLKALCCLLNTSFRL